MAFYKEEETALAIENWSKWSGDQCGSPQSVKFDEVAINARDMRCDGGFVNIPVISFDASRTHERLASLAANKRHTLIFFHTKVGSLRIKARSLATSETALIKTLQVAHLEFWAYVPAKTLHETRANARVCENVS